MHLICPNCQRPLVVPNERAGHLMQCPLCKVAFTAPEAPPGGFPEARPPEAEPATPGAPATPDPSQPAPFQMLPEEREKLDVARMADAEISSRLADLYEKLRDYDRWVRAGEIRPQPAYEAMRPEYAELRDESQSRRHARAAEARDAADVDRQAENARVAAEYAANKQREEEASNRKELAKALREAQAMADRAASDRHREGERARRQAERRQAQAENAAAREVAKIERDMEAAGRKAARDAERAQRAADRQQAKEIEAQQKGDRALAGRYETAVADYQRTGQAMARRRLEREDRNQSRRWGARRRVASRLGLGLGVQAFDFARDVGDAFGFGDEGPTQGDREAHVRLDRIAGLIEELVREMGGDGASLSERNMGETPPSSPDKGPGASGPARTVLDAAGGQRSLSGTADSVNRLVGALRGPAMRPAQNGAGGGRQGRGNMVAEVLRFLGM